MKNAFRLGSLLAFTLMSTAREQSAEAQSIVATPTGLCNPLHGHTDLWVDGVALNHSTMAVQSLMCSFGATGKNMTVNVDYTDKHQSQKITCALAVVPWSNPTGLPLYEAVKTSPTGQAAGGVMTFNVPSTAVGYGHLRCDIPPVGAGGMSGIFGFNYGPI
jgi:hypothetical protein